MAEPDWRTEKEGGRIHRNRRVLKDKRPIPGGITLDDFREIQKLLAEIFQDIKKNTGGTEPQELHMRLNESEKPWPLPIFVGWHEDSPDNRIDYNHPHPALWRFGDDVLSEVYAEAINFADEEGDKAFQFRNWHDGQSEMLEKRAGERATDPKAGNNFQTCLAIVIDNETPRVVEPGKGEAATFRRAVGTLVLGFRQKPGGDVLTKAHQIMREWALEKVAKTDPKRGGLIAWLKQEFDLGGPLLRATPNTLDNRWLHRR